MTVEEHADGASAVAGPPRLHLNTRQKLGILSACGAVAMSAVFLMGHFGGKPEEHKTDTSLVATGLQFSAPPEAKPVDKPLPMPMVAPPSFPAVQPRVNAPEKEEYSGMSAFRGGGSGDSEGGSKLARAEDGDNGGVKDGLSAALLHSDIGADAKATLMKHPTLTIPAGTLIPCTLQTAINSQLPGFVTCVTPREVRSATGTVTLLDRGTQIMGEVQHGVTRGMDRLFILWVRARTPENVKIALDSPAADELGRSGITGDINNHWLKRFGNALLFSIVGAAPQVASSALQGNGGNNSNSFVQFAAPDQQVANTVLQNEINIPPTLEANQGTTVSIMVARDLDFSGVYDLKKVDP